ncbi:MAG: DMT family transporter [Rickettsiaceae bacterium H1]|nr:DMT family transporter [Rickettsiaceae bacterium H1]
MTKNIAGIFWMLIHVMTAATIAMFYRILSASFDKLYISFFYNFSAFLIVLPFVIKKRAKLIKSCFLRAHAIRSACYIIAQLMLIFVYNNMPFAQVAAITITYPLFTTVSAVLFLKERIGIHRFIALIIGFIGAAIIVNPNPHSFNKYSLIAVLAIILWTSFDIITNKVGRKESMSEQLLHTLIFMGLFSILPATAGHVPTNINIYYIGLFILIGLIVILYCLSGLLAVAEAEINIVSPFYFTVLPISSCISYFVFDEQIEIRTIVGAGIIITSAIYIAYREYRAKQVAKQLQQSRLI